MTSRSISALLCRRQRALRSRRIVTMRGEYTKTGPEPINLSPALIWPLRLAGFIDRVVGFHLINGVGTTLCHPEISAGHPDLSKSGC
jgi:hypothetical protein